MKFRRIQAPKLPNLISKGLPLVIIAVSLLLFFALKATKTAPEKKAQNDVLPLIEVIQVQPEQVQFEVSSYGVVKPKYHTQLVAQVSGRLQLVTDDFVAGALVLKDEELAKIEDADYNTEYVQAKANLAKAEASYQREVAEGKVAAEDWKNITDQEPTDLGLRKPQLKQEKANVSYAQAAVKRAKRNLERTSIRAPFAGLIRSRSVDQGQFITAGQQIGELYDTRVAEVRLPINNQEVGFLPDYNNIDTTVALTANLGGKTLTWYGRITRDEGVIDDTNRMIYLVAEVRDPYMQFNADAHPQALKYGSFVTAKIQGVTLEPVYKLPRFLVRDNQVLIVNENTLRQQKVTVIRTDTEYAYISEGLKDGDILSVTQLENVTNGMRVKFINAPQPYRPDATPVTQNQLDAPSNPIPEASTQPAKEADAKAP